uniref:Uncharacterized protein n=1 Tax=Cacopsylla melanoneura TaxID=428564 RepID=A0A8D8TNY9_9HEMI
MMEKKPGFFPTLSLSLTAVFINDFKLTWSQSMARINEQYCSSSYRCYCYYKRLFILMNITRLNILHCACVIFSQSVVSTDASFIPLWSIYFELMNIQIASLVKTVTETLSFFLAVDFGHYTNSSISYE